jgi:ATP adenylyltransferase
MLNRYPYNAGHLMVTLNRHRGEPSQLTQEEWRELWETVAEMVSVLKRLLRPHGFNVGVNIGRAAGAGIPGHLHVHVVPRWIGDTNFATSISQMKVVSASLDALYRRLKPHMPAHRR